MRPFVHGVRVHRDDVLVSQKEERFQRLVGALPCIHQAIRVNPRKLERRVAGVGFR